MTEWEARKQRIVLKWLIERTKHYVQEREQLEQDGNFELSAALLLVTRALSNERRLLQTSSEASDAAQQAPP